MSIINFNKNSIIYNNNLMFISFIKSLKIKIRNFQILLNFLFF